MTVRTLRSVRRVMLIFPPMHDIRHVDTMVCPPMGIASLAAHIRDRVEVQLLDCLAENGARRVAVSEKIERVGLPYDDILARIRGFAPDMVGLSCIFSSQFSCVTEIARRVKKEIDPEMIVVTGGTHPSFLPEMTLEHPYIDYVVLGEGELGLERIIEAHNSGGRIEDIDGIAFRTKSGVQVNPRTTWIEDLDVLPLPARDLLPMENYFAATVPMGLHWRKKRNTPIVSSRGCPFGCPFCSSHLHWGKRFRKRSAENVLAEIEHLKSRYNIQELKWQDDNLTADRNRAKAIFSGMIDRGLTMPWNTPNGIALWTLDEEMLALMKKSGCYELTLAIESGDPLSFARYVRKPFTLDKARHVAALARRTGIATVAYFIIGFPGETLAQIENSMRYALLLGADYLVPFIYNPLPGSELWKRCVDEGLISDTYAYEGGNNYFQSDLSGADFTSKDLRRIQSLTYFKNLLRLPFRNPREFAAWYSRQLFAHPDFLRTFFLHVRQTLLRQ
ncbi:B12-binding domain-containing radical SAM protein [Desulfosudis oleivorans]|uniref:Radical SAM domain protein n=1 Tax=Desulfosudis oleivorans (strain DSM 6200 / JCM 39069 / Hxd3) TaxID=96561 RepID=A8ZVQ0_DESOH|nr:radical SAM protein [Desulfosudis oleivorans]ABW68237.1 Radical SAM domain protein [Desulfosudis oleivorans Hxd3]